MSILRVKDELGVWRSIPAIKGEKGDKGDKGEATEAIKDDVIDSDHTWSSSKIDATKLDKTGDASSTTVDFTEATERESVNTGESSSTLFGKVKKWFGDLKTVAFTGSYDDLIDAPESLPANGGNADTLGGLSSDDYRQTKHKVLSNGSSLFSYVLNDMKDSTSEVVRIYDGTDVPAGYIASAGSDFIFHIDKIDNGYSIIRAHDNRSNREFMIRSNSGKWDRWKEVGYGGMTYLIATGVDLFTYIESLTDEQFPPHSTISVRSFNCKNSPIDGYPVKVEYELSNGGDFIVEVTRLEHRDWYTLVAKEIPTNKTYRCIKHNNVWQAWRPLGDIVDLPVGTNIFTLSLITSDKEWFTVKTYRIAHSASAPLNFGYNPNNNDFIYTVNKMSNTWMRIIARDVWTNREFVNTCNDGHWIGWEEMLTNKNVTVAAVAPPSPQTNDLWVW